MAQVTQVRLVDDLDGGDADESVAFSLDGRVYEIDLSEKHAADLRNIFAPFVGGARRAGRSTGASRGATRSSSAPGDRERNAEIRAWAKEQGLSTSERGRISSAVLSAFEDRHSAPAAPVESAEDVTEPVAETAAEKPKRARRKKAAAAS